MVDVDTLEVLLEHLQLAQAAVADAPVGQHRQHGGEEIGKTLYMSVC